VHTDAPEPRPPRWERRPETRPHEILEAALRVFAARGYRATPLEAVAEAAGVTKGTLYHYFESKRDLLAQAVAHRQQQRSARYAQLTGELVGPVAVKLRVLVRQALAESLEPANVAVMRLLTGELSVELPELAGDALAQTLVRGWTLLGALIREGQATGEFRPDADADVIARVFISGLSRQAELLATGRTGAAGTIDPLRLGDAAVEFLLHGLRPAGSASAVVP
jgi:AcrR family transcriptional regulator